MNRPPFQPPVRKPVVKVHHGPNWKFIVHLFIIAGLLYAIFIAWQNLGAAKAKREEENRKAAAKRAKAYQEAWEEARRKANERNTPTLPDQPESSSETDMRPNAQPRRTAGNPDTERGSTRSNVSSGPSTTQAQAAEAELGPEFAALKSRARELITAAMAKRDEQLAQNARSLTWNLDVWLRGLNKSEQIAWRPYVEKLKAATTRTRVPDSSLDSSDIKMSEKMASLARDAAKKQESIELDFLSETGKIHRAYLAKIREAITKAESSGQSATASALSQIIESSSDLDSWIDSLGVDLQSTAGKSGIE